MEWSRHGVVAAKPSQSSETVSGRAIALVIFARFQDEDDGSDAVPEFAGQIFDPRLPGSLTHFYNEMSRGQFALEGTALPRWYTSSQPASSYLAEQDGERGGYGRFVRDILLAVDADTNLSEFDNDGPDGVANSGDDDGQVDFLFLVLRSTPARFIVTRATGISGLGLDSDFTTRDVDVRGRFTSVRTDGLGGSLQRGRTAAEAIGSMAHEFGHTLGLPDLFDTDFTNEGGELDPAEDSAGVGYWGLMAHGARGWQDRGGPNPFCAWSLAQLGWIGVANGDLVDVAAESPEDLSFDDFLAGGRIFRFPAADPAVYHLMEYRTPQFRYYERDLPGPGILIWRIDENNRSTANDNERAKLVDLVSADGLFADAGFPIGERPQSTTGRDNLDYWAHDVDYVRDHAGNLGDATDLFAGERDEFSVLTNPASPQGMSLSGIRKRGDGAVASINLLDDRWAGRIEGRATWSGTVKIVGDVTVLPGAELTISGGTVVLVGPDGLNSGLDETRSELAVRGILRTSGGGEILFTSAAEAPAAGDWYGITAGALGSLNLRHAMIEYAVTGITVAPLSAITPTSAQVLESVTVRFVSADGIRLASDGVTQLSEIEVIGVPGHGAVLEGQGAVALFDSHFEANGGDGLLRLGGPLECRRSTFAHNAAGSEDGANLVVGSGATGLVSECVFEGGVGIRIQGAANVTVERNQLGDDMIAIMSVSSSPRIERNVITDSGVAFDVSGILTPAQIALNTIENPLTLIANRSQMEVLAARNWWGNDDESFIAAHMEGSVSWQPALNFDPRQPVSFELSQNHPNPFNASTVIDYTVGFAPASIEAGSETALEIRAISGALIRRLIREPSTPGIFTVRWDGRDERGQAVASGVYLYELKVGPIVFGRKLMVLR